MFGETESARSNHTTTARPIITTDDSCVSSRAFNLLSVSFSLREPTCSRNYLIPLLASRSPPILQNIIENSDNLPKLSHFDSYLLQLSPFFGDISKKKL